MDPTGCGDGHKRGDVAVETFLDQVVVEDVEVNAEVAAMAVAGAIADGMMDVPGPESLDQADAGIIPVEMETIAAKDVRVQTVSTATPEKAKGDVQKVGQSISPPHGPSSAEMGVEVTRVESGGEAAEAGLQLAHASANIPESSDRKRKLREDPESKDKKLKIGEVSWVGEPIPVEKAKEMWPNRYKGLPLPVTVKKRGKKPKGPPQPELTEEVVIDTDAIGRHYEEAVVDGYIHVKLGDCVSLKGDQVDFLAIVHEMFEGQDGDKWFAARWFYRDTDTILNETGITSDSKHDPRNVYLAHEKTPRDDNLLNSVTGKPKIVFHHLQPPAKDGSVPSPPKDCDFYYSMKYGQSYTSFIQLHEPGHGEFALRQKEVETSTPAPETPAQLEASGPMEIDTRLQQETTAKQEEEVVDLTAEPTDTREVKPGAPEGLEEIENDEGIQAEEKGSEENEKDKGIKVEEKDEAPKTKRKPGRIGRTGIPKTRPPLPDTSGWSAPAGKHAAEYHTSKASEGSLADVSTPVKKSINMLDLYSGCGGMSTGLEEGTRKGGVLARTKWAVDLNPDACESMRQNHPYCHVRNEAAEDFLSVLKEWAKLVHEHAADVIPNEDALAGGITATTQARLEEIEKPVRDSEFQAKKSKGRRKGKGKVTGEDEDEPPYEDDDRAKISDKVKAAPVEPATQDEAESDLEEGEYHVKAIIGMRWVGPSEDNKGLEYKIRWGGSDEATGRPYDESDDTWEPEEMLQCPDKLRDFIREGRRANMLPVPGDELAICGGPPCQGVSGFNRFRNKENPLDDPRNEQMKHAPSGSKGFLKPDQHKVYMDIVGFLRPKWVLMENVVDIVKFADGFLGRYAMRRLLKMDYQVRVGLMVAGCYGVPQFRMRAFFWAAMAGEELPAFPLPTHHVDINRGGIPKDWDHNFVAWDADVEMKLANSLVLADALSDLPLVDNWETKDVVELHTQALTEFQKLIRRPRPGEAPESPQLLYNHIPLRMNEDDLERSSLVPKRKDACFRDLPGVEIDSEGIAKRSQNVHCKSGKLLVPEYALNYIQGKSNKPFRRLWWDETVATVVTRAEPHNQSVLHPEQDRVLTVRENARIQGFPDYYRFCGSTKERYKQIGNAVAVPVGAALGYALSLAVLRKTNGQDVCKLPWKQ